jgi:hypothetical protein
MLKVVQKLGSERKLRLITVAAARLVWDQILAGEMREAVEAAESRAELKIGQEILDAFRHRFYEYMFGDAPEEERRWDRNPAMKSVFALVLATTYPDSTLRSLAKNKYWRAGVEPRGQPVSDIVRDIFGNPFRPTTLDLDWRTTTVIQLAQGMYDSRDFGAMPILADALQDAGCENADVLDHCRGSGPHVRGCWVIDLLLGKE